MAELNVIASWIGYATLAFLVIAAGLALIGILLWFVYAIYDAGLKRLLGWKDRQTREDIIYFIRHKQEIQDCIQRKYKSNPLVDKDLKR